MQHVVSEASIPGILAPGDHALTWTAFASRFGGSTHRENLIVNLLRLLGVLARRGFEGAVYVGGSFITAKEEPGDIDIVLDCSALPARQWPVFARFVLQGRGMWKSALGIDLHLSHPSIPRDMRDWFRYIRGDDASQLSTPGTVGLVVLTHEHERTERPNLTTRRQG
jgi:hypothetical protein